MAGLAANGADDVNNHLFARRAGGLHNCDTITADNCSGRLYLEGNDIHREHDGCGHHDGLRPIAATGAAYVEHT